VEVVASLTQGRTAAAQCGLFTHMSVPVILEPPCNCLKRNKFKFYYGNGCSNMFCFMLISVLCTCRLVHSGEYKLCLIIINSMILFGISHVCIEDNC
jgi:hypothetical protein